jgi:hypothetical protein
MTILISPDGEHSEWFWAREFEKAFMWLFYPQLLNGNEELFEPGVVLYPVPFNDILNVSGSGQLDITVFSLDGKEILQTSIIEKGQINLKKVGNGVILIVIVKQGNSIRTFKVFKK